MTFQYHSNSKIIQLGLFLTLTSALILSCHKKTDIPDPNAELNLKKAPAIDSDSLKSLEMEDSAKDSSATDPMVHADSGAAHWKLHFTSRPQVLAYPNHPFQYRPVLASKPLKEGEGNNPDGHLGRTSDKGANSIKIIQGPDSMKIQNGQVLWMPKVLGNFPVTIEAMGENNKAQQSFVIKVTKIIDLVLKPLPTQINKGDSVLFDLSTSIYPTWALPDTKVRYDFDGDGKWDTDPLPLSENLKIHHAYGVAGKFTAIIETHFKNLESAKVEANISVIGAVNAAVKIWPDTVEPGANLNIDASASKGDGQLRYSIDWNNDGKADWSDSLAGKGIAKAPGSGKYIALLTVKNSQGQSGQAQGNFIVNAKPTVELKVKNPKVDMAMEVLIKVRAKDIDDSLSVCKINYTGEEKDWAIRTAPADSIINAGDQLFRFRHVYGKVGKFNLGICIQSKDGREVCKSQMIEIFNADPISNPGPDFDAIVGKPIEVEGNGIDPDGKIVKWEWDLDADGKYDLTSSENGKFKYTFAKVGIFPLTLRVTTADGKMATGTRKVRVRKS